MNENGVLAANLPFSGANQHISITRHAHPHVLRQFAELLNDVFGTAFFSVINPSALMTKADEMEVLRDLSALVTATRSCENVSQQMAKVRAEKSASSYKECGICIPCLIRRQAIKTVGVEEAPSHYLHEDRTVFNWISSNEPAQTDGQPALLRSTASKLLESHQFNVRDVVNFCQAFQRLSPAEFVVKYLPEISLLTQPDGDSEKYVADLYELYQKFTAQYLNYLPPSPI
jgi:hypothetical protein